jgi:Ca2+-binding RTX toxin-like protein
LEGGVGNDTLYGGAGDDTFVFNLGDGQDTIQADDASGFDRLRFGAGIAASDLTLIKTGNDLVVEVGSGGDQVKLQYWFHPSYADRRMDQFLFADGTVLSRDELMAQKPAYGIGTPSNDSLQGYEGVDVLSGDSGSDTLLGYGGNDVLLGGEGNDNLQGGDGDDVLDGSTGNDSLNGGPGNDIYRFALGDGFDTINNYDTTGFDRILFEAGIDTTGVALFRNGNNLEVGYGVDDQFSVSNYFTNDNYKVDEVQLADGSYLTDADVNQLIQQMAAFAVDEGIAMNSLNDVRNNQELMTLVANSWHTA